MKHKTNPELIRLVRALKERARESRARIWRSVADSLICSRKRSISVNMSRLNRCTQKGDTAVVPGKVLGVGIIEHPLNVAAIAFSKLARTKILKAKGKCLSFYELMEKNPKGSQVKIIG